MQHNCSFSLCKVLLELMSGSFIIKQFIQKYNLFFNILYLQYYKLNCYIFFYWNNNCTWIIPHCVLNSCCVYGPAFSLLDTWVQQNISSLLGSSRSRSRVVAFGERLCTNNTTVKIKRRLKHQESAWNPPFDSCYLSLRKYIFTTLSM